MKITVILFLTYVFSFQVSKAANIRALTFNYPHLSAIHATNERIVGGEYADVGQFPYQAAVIINGAALCGGSLISDYQILTSARCVVGFNSFEVHLGATNIYDFTEPGRIQITSSDARVHADYDGTHNDIAVIVLPVLVTGFDPIRLPLPLQLVPIGDTTLASGWGLTSDSDSSISAYLKFTNMTVISNAECAMTYNFISYDHLCTDTTNINGEIQSTCSGDTGGPLVYTEQDGILTVVGITSFGSLAGCEAGHPAGFTRVSIFVSWLKEVAGVIIESRT